MSGTFLILAAMTLAAFAALAWPRRVTHRYELFIAAPPQRVWDNYFVHISKKDYRPGTRILDAAVVSPQPLTVRVRVQFDISSTPAEYLLIYDLYEPYTRYRLHRDDSKFIEEGQFIPESGGTRLRIGITGPMFGFVLPLLARRRVERNQQALRDVCEGRATAPPRGPLPKAQPWEPVVLFAAVASPFLPLPWALHLAFAGVGIAVAAWYLRRLLVFARRL
ncbi:MAG: hypothetical protein JO213_10585 [Alphaproteobacteria bacterium]|nr:hypothetical protein [Alphaproteobacteria bacterium]MBV9153160.1 hypothetical protein [Alphaproteobacteria bacterium]MBV9585321.1 hypothetical protein [Alphaproteobacteria bacterium]MBV9965503.1 hypothetical protein [Alphaproteobacteria bacterium]